MKKFFVLAGLISLVGLATVNAPSSKTGKGGFTSPTTTKGDLIVRNSTIDTRLGIGANGLVLTADSGEATGMKWGSVAGTGDVVGPASSTDEGICRMDGTTGKAIQNSSSTLTDAGIMQLASTGGLGMGATPTANNIFHFRKDNNGQIRATFSNQDTGSSAYMRFTLSSDAGDIDFDANSAAAGGLADLRIGSGYTGGLRIMTLGATPVNIGTNSAADFTIDSDGAVTLGESSSTDVHGAYGTGFDLRSANSGGTNYVRVRNTSDTSSSDAKLAAIVGGTSGGDAYTEYSGTGSAWFTGMDNSDSDKFKISLTGLGTTDFLSINTSGAMTLGQSGSSENISLNAGALKFIPTTSTTDFLFNDGSGSTASLRLLGGASTASGEIQLYGGSHASKAKQIEFKTDATVQGTVDSAGLWTLTDVAVNGMTASRVAVTNGSKKLISSSMTQTLLESLTSEQIDGLIESPAATTYIVRLNAKYATTINNISIKTSAGTVTAKLQIDGVDVTSCTGISVSSTESTTTCTAANTVDAGDTIQLVLSSLSSAANLSFSVGLTRN